MTGHSIFISYRRLDAGGHGRALHEYLSGRFGDNSVFFDRNTIESGDEFPDKLRQGVEECAVLLALIGPEWLDTRDKDGTRRLEDEHDFVRREIALALARGKKVIPVLFDDTPIPPRNRLPNPLQGLASCDPLTLRGKMYEYQTQRRELVRLLAKMPGIPQPISEGEGPRVPQDRKAYKWIKTLPVWFLHSSGFVGTYRRSQIDPFYKFVDESKSNALRRFYDVDLEDLRVQLVNELRELLSYVSKHSGEVMPDILKIAPEARHLDPKWFDGVLAEIAHRQQQVVRSYDTLVREADYRLGSPEEEESET